MRFGQDIEPVCIPDKIIEVLKDRCNQGEPLHTLFNAGETVEISKGPFKGFLGFFEKIQTLPDGLARAFLLVEILGQMQHLELSLSHLKKSTS